MYNLKTKMIIPARVSAIIIKSKKVLLVTAHDKKYYWTPGGRLYVNESRTAGLRREIKEELSTTIVKSQYYLTYITTDEHTHKKQNVFCYLVHIKGKVIINHEIQKYKYVSKGDILTGKVAVTKGFYNYLLPKIVKNKFL